ncbi:MAG: hypothetical protein AABM67_03645 [Acidobacteriota bacterium]
MESEEHVADQPALILGKHNIRSDYLDKSLFVVVAVVLLFTVVLLYMNLSFQRQNYAAGITAALKSDNVDHAVVIAYTRAWDFAIAKISSIFLAFCLIMVGALYVLRAASVSYSLSVAHKSRKGSLETGSPGLVMITLGVILMAVVMFSTSRVDFQSSDVSRPREPQMIPPDALTTPDERDLPTPRPSKSK